MRMFAIAVAAFVTGVSVGVAASKPAMQMQPADDSAVAGIIRTANESEIEAGNAALKKARSKDVKEFARMMVEEHERSNQEIAAVLKRSGIEAGDNETTVAMREDAKKQNAQLMDQRGSTFDHAYVAQQVKAHQQVLDTIDQALASSDKRDEAFESLLRKTRETVAKHLQHAQRLQSKSHH
jgi:putative membrane protein